MSRRSITVLGTPALVAEIAPWLAEPPEMAPVLRLARAFPAPSGI